MRGSLPNDSGTPEDTMVASTQTAVLLAELAADSTQTSTDLTQTSSPGIDCSGFCPEQPLSVQVIVVIYFHRLDNPGMRHNTQSEDKQNTVRKTHKMSNNDPHQKTGDEQILNQMF